MFRIVGIEATQAIQVFRSTFPLCTTNGQPAPCADNSIPLVAGRRTTLRVYTEDAPPGTLVGALATRGFPYDPGTQSFLRVGTPIPAPPSPIVRADAAHTVQIDLPVWPAGTWRFNVSAVAQLGSSIVAWASRSIELDFTNRRMARIRLVRIRYRGRGMDVAAPSTADFWTSADFAQRVLPLPHPGFEVVGDGVADYDGDFTRIDPGAHDPAWPGYAANNGTTGNLLNIMDRAAAAESLPGDVIYLGLYPDGVNQAGFTGWAVSRWILTGLNGSTVAHEVAHKLNVPLHAPCGNPAAVDPSYPIYGNLPSGSIGEVGYDAVLSQTLDPATRTDLMTYCSPQWISPHNYRKVFDALPPIPPPEQSPPLFEFPRKVVIGLTRFPDRYVRIDIPPFPRPLPAGPRRAGAVVGEIRLLGPRGETLSRAPAELQAAIEVEPDTAPPLILAEVPWSRDAVAFEFRDERGAVLIEQELGGTPPSVRVAWPSTTGVLGRDAVVRWEMDEPRDAWVAVRASADQGRTWTSEVRPAADGRLQLAALIGDAPGSRIFELIAAGGGSAVVERSPTFRVRARAAQLFIFSPEPGSAHDYGTPIRFEATPEFGARSSIPVEWYSDLDGYLATGTDCVVLGLTPGSHRVEARYSGGGSTAAVEVTVRGIEQTTSSPEASPVDHD